MNVWNRNVIRLGMCDGWRAIETRDGKCIVRNTEEPEWEHCIKCGTEKELDWTGLGKNVKEGIERQMTMMMWRGITSSDYIRRAIKDGEVDEEEEEKIRRERREEMKEEETQKMMIELAMDEEVLFEKWVKHEKRRRCTMRAEEGHRRV